MLGQRTSARMFDFDLDSERAAMGELLYRIVEKERPTSGHMISALVIYLNENDAGTGFYTYAQDLGVLRHGHDGRRAAGLLGLEIAAIHRHYSRRRDRRHPPNISGSPSARGRRLERNSRGHEGALPDRP